MLVSLSVVAVMQVRAEPIEYHVAYRPTLGPSGTGSFVFDDTTGVMTSFVWDYEGVTGGLSDALLASELGDGSWGALVFEMLSQTDAHPINCVANGCGTGNFVDIGTGPFGDIAFHLNTSFEGAVTYWWGDSTNIVAEGSVHITKGTAIDIDVRPGSTHNDINPRSAGNIPVAILGSREFDALQVDVSTVSFGPGAAPAISEGRVEDVDGNGFADVVLRFSTHAANFACSDTDAVLTGETFSGEPFTGIDSIRTVGCN